MAEALSLPCLPMVKDTDTYRTPFNEIGKISKFLFIEVCKNMRYFLKNPCTGQVGDVQEMSTSTSII